MAASEARLRSEHVLRFRERNSALYRLAHWPIWIFVFFIAAGPLTFDLFEGRFDQRAALWLGAVLVATGIAGLRGSLPGVEPRPYILRFTEDKPNPLYRRICYTAAWGDLIGFAVLNLVWPHLRGCHGPLAVTSNLRVRVLPAGHCGVDLRRAGPAAAGRLID